MLEQITIDKRLVYMSTHPDHAIDLWPENCEGSRMALVIFVGPSPGGQKEEKRRNIIENKNIPYWNQSYTEPKKWGQGFNKSFEPIVEAIFNLEYGESAKLIARMNLDWLPNPKASDVPYRYMYDGFSYIYPALIECNPELIIPMEENAYNILEIGFHKENFEIIPLKLSNIKVLISDKEKKKRFHREVVGFWAVRQNHRFLIIKLLQHPAMIFDEAYAKRIGKAIRNVIDDISGLSSI